MKLLAVAFMKSRTYIFQQIYIVPFFYSSLAVEMSCKYKILKSLLWQLLFEKSVCIRILF